jgi:hypothetical protein
MSCDKSDATAFVRDSDRLNQPKHGHTVGKGHYLIFFKWAAAFGNENLCRLDADYSHHRPRRFEGGTHRGGRGDAGALIGG